jgi:AhpD family alkylhydroperoxidase
MEARYEFVKVSPEAYAAMAQLEKYLAGCGLEKGVSSLMKVRASQINGCGYCIDMHWKEARAAGESEQRLYGLSAWEESPYYTDRERAALAWCEAVTLVHEGHVPDGVYGRVREHFSEKELADLTWVVAAINTWNRVVTAARSVPGNYRVEGK